MARTSFLFPKETLAPTIISDTADRKFSCYPIVCYAEWHPGLTILYLKQPYHIYNSKKRFSIKKEKLPISASINKPATHSHFIK